MFLLIGALSSLELCDVIDDDNIHAALLTNYVDIIIIINQRAD
jgi:hypothetical protein